MLGRTSATADASPSIRRRLPLAAVVALAAVLALPVAANAQDIFLQTSDPAFAGEVAGAGTAWRGAARLSTLSWNVKASAAPAGPSFSDLRLTKPVDRSSPAFMRAATTGTRIARARISLLRHISGTTPQLYHEYCLGNVQVMSDQVEAEDADEAEVETVSLRFDRLAQRYTPWSSGVAGPPVSYGWDVLNIRPFGTDDCSL